MQRSTALRYTPVLILFWAYMSGLPFFMADLLRASDILAHYDLDDMGGSAIGNALLTASDPKAAAEQSTTTQAAPSEPIAAQSVVPGLLSDKVVEPAASEALAVDSAAKISAESSYVSIPVDAEWKNPLEVLAALPVDKWDLKDSLLALETSFALMSESVVKKIQHLRKETRALWLEWKKADAKSAPFTNLTKQIQKLADKPDMFPGANDEVAEWIILADIGADGAEYLQALLKLTKHVSYNYLLMSVLGAPSFDTKEARVINGASLSDMQCRNRFFAILAAFYRREYDERVQAARDYQTLVYGKRFTVGQTDLLLLEESEYLSGEVPEIVKLNAGFNPAEWREVARASRVRAHEETYSVAQKKLDNIGNVLFLFQARLESVRVPDNFFQYPDAIQASSAALYDTHILSILVGVLYRLGERMCRGKKASFMDYADMQAVLAQEYKGQRLLRHIMLDVPVGEKDSRGSMPGPSSKPFEVDRRRSFEARLALLLGDIDFFESKSLAPVVKEAIGKLSGVMAASKLYKTIMLQNCYINGLAWGMIPPRNKEKVLGKLQEGVAVVRGNLEKLGLSVENQEAVAKSYRQLLNVINTWSPHTAFTYKSVFGLTNAGRRRIAQVKCSPQIYQALYKLLWLYIWARLQVVVSLQNQERLVKKTAAEVSLRESDIVFDEKGMLRTDIGPAQEKQAREPGALQKIRDTVATLSYRGQQGANKLRTKGDIDGGFDEALNGLSDMANLIEDLKPASVDLFKQSDKVANRFSATTKALVAYTHRLSDFAIKKIGKIQKGIRDFAGSAKVKLAVFLTKIPGLKTAFRKLMNDFLSTVKEGDDAQEERYMKEALIDVQRAMSGELDASKIVLPMQSSKMLQDINERASMTLEGRDKAVGQWYGIGEKAPGSVGVAG
ncbi:MAG: hypothetical protein QG632_230 [Candidatus Dependentiae bacterium]|nr:hypothetical protein [Candidatus Dependentiae bacterium]